LPLLKLQPSYINLYLAQFFLADNKLLRTDGKITQLTSQRYSSDSLDLWHYKQHRTIWTQHGGSNPRYARFIAVFTKSHIWSFRSHEYTLLPAALFL